MFKIQDGRKSFTQWDLNRKIIVEDDSIVKVHFTNLLNKTALVSEVKNHLADVPNVLLQDYGTILIYGYDGNYTKYVEAFRVVRKEKPEDYIYTETEVLNYNNLLERMNNIEGSIEQVVTDYLRENPPKVDLDGYATKEYVDNAIAAISAVDLSDYFTKEEANAKFATKEEIPSTSGLATEEFVNGKVSGLASESYVDDAEYTWSKIHLRDDFGRLIYEDAVFENEDGITYTEKHPKKNPDYNPEEKYIARSKRKEWDVVGMLGKLYVRDDGTCGAGGYAKVGADGIATLSQEPTNMYVMKRTAANIVRVLFK